jgi:hypothetical protein
VPVSLGPKINDGLAHRWDAYVTPDSKYLFYTRGASAKDSAIYWVRFDTLLESLRPKQIESMLFRKLTVAVCTVGSSRNRPEGKARY